MASPQIIVQAKQGVLAAEYQWAATLSDCTVTHTDDSLNNLQSLFSAKIVSEDTYWVMHATHLILCIKKVFWKWPIRGYQGNGEIQGMVWGSPSIETSLPPSLMRYKA